MTTINTLLRTTKGFLLCWPTLLTSSFAILSIFSKSFSRRNAIASTAESRHSLAAINQKFTTMPNLIKKTALDLQKTSSHSSNFLTVAKKVELIITNIFDSSFTTKISDTYDAGLPDIQGPKPMTLIFFKDRVKVCYKEYLFFTRAFIIQPNDILELDMKVQNADTVTNAMMGALAGSMVAGGFGALAVGGTHAKRRKEDYLHIIINYKGQPRPLFFQKIKNSQRLFKEFKKIYDKRTIIHIQPNSIIPNISSDIAKQLIELNYLVQQGILTKEEFEVQKSKILSA